MIVDIAGIWLALLVLTAVIYVLRLFFRGDYSLWESMLFLPAYLFARLLWRVQFTNEPPEAIRSGAILAANHRSSIDPMFIQVAARRRVHWMVAKEYCQNFAFGPVLKVLQVIPTNRTGTDITSTKVAMSFARQGKLVGMFPEGRINVTPDPLLPLRAGAAMIAAKASVPIIPILIQGSPYEETYSVVSPFLMWARVKVTFGQPVFANIEIASESNCRMEDNSADESQPVEPQKMVSGNEDDTDHSVEPSDSQSRRSRRTIVNEQVASLIRRWADEILKMLGRTDFEVQIGSAARRRA